MNLVYFLPIYYKDTSRLNSASARYRAIWPAKYLKNATVWKDGDNIHAEIDNAKCLYIQKICNPESIVFAEYAKSKNKLTILDLTDPIWKYNQYFTDMLHIVDLVVVSSLALKQEYLELGYKKTIYAIEDGEDLDLYKKFKSDYSIKDRKPIVSWTGIKDTYPNLYYALKILKPLEGEIELKVIADQPPEQEFNGLQFIKWELEKANDEILNSDIFINPRDPNLPKNKLKSNNKTNLAWGLGVPAVYSWNNPDNALKELISLIRGEEFRIRNAESGRNKVLHFYNMSRVADELINIISYHLNEINFIQFQFNKLRIAIKAIRNRY